MPSDAFYYACLLMDGPESCSHAKNSAMLGSNLFNWLASSPLMCF